MVAAGYIDKNKEAEAADMAWLQDYFTRGKFQTTVILLTLMQLLTVDWKYNLTEEEIVNNGYRILYRADQNY